MKDTERESGEQISINYYRMSDYRTRLFLHVAKY